MSEVSAERPEIKRKALVTGAAGAIGRTLVERLLHHGYDVRAMVRGPASAVGFPAGVEVVAADITDCKLVRQAVTDMDVVFHLAAKLHVNDPAASLRDEYFRVNVEGTRCLASAAHVAGVERFIFFSTINVYGPTLSGQIHDEHSRLQPDSWYAKTKIEGEEIVLAEMSSVVLRLAATYGPGMKGNYPRLVRALRGRRLALVGDGSNRRTIVHTEDACDAAITAAERGEALGQVYNVTDGGVHTMREIIKAIAAALGRSQPKLRLPEGPVRLAAGLLEDGLKVVGKRSPVNRATIDKMTEDIAISGEKMKRELGFIPNYDLQKGWRATIEQMSI